MRFAHLVHSGERCEVIINNAHLVTLWREKPIVPESLLVIDDKTILDFGRVGKLADRPISMDARNGVVEN